DSSKHLKILKIVALAFSGLLLFWFTFDVTGLKFGNVKIVTSAFVDEPVDFVFYLIFIASIVCFILKDKIGKYTLSVFLLLWGAFQLTIYFKSGESIAAYNNTFADTHHIIAASNVKLVKDTYHIFLDVFILLALISAIIFFIAEILHIKKSKMKANEL
ncbi:MAG: hypothetical protein K2G96_02180, partial [Clostridia bacterium]|nr:hypothetical protein [Clostridia bacterium]